MRAATPGGILEHQLTSVADGAIWEVHRHPAGVRADIDGRGRLCLRGWWTYVACAHSGLRPRVNKSRGSSEQVVGGPAHLVGWSDGGIVVLLVVLQRPDLVRRLVVVGAIYHFDGFMNVEMDPESSLVQALGEAYIERSPDGPEHLEVAFSKSFRMFGAGPTLTTADLAQIARPVLVVAGGDDLVALPHTVSLYEAIPEGQLAVVPGASHALPLEQPDVLTGSVRTARLG